MLDHLFGRRGIFEADEAESLRLSGPVSHDGNRLDFSEGLEELLQRLLVKRSLLRESLHVDIVERLAALLGALVVLQDCKLAVLESISQVLVGSVYGQVVLVHLQDVS